MRLKRAGRFLPSDLEILRRNDKQVGRNQSRRRRAPLSIERCEERCLLAANDVSGTKFEDLTGNGFTPDDIPLGGFDIQLYRDGGDGVFDLVDDVLVNTETSDALTGNYTFTNVSDGKYFIQEVQQPGFTQTAPIPSFYTINVAGGCVFTDNAFTVDSFNLPNPAATFIIDLLDPDPTLIKNTVAGVVGGERDLLIDVAGNPGLNTALGAVGFQGGSGAFRGTFGAPGSTATLEYDGLDADIVGPPAGLVNNEGLTTDLTNGGINTGFRIDTFALDVGSGATMRFRIELTGPGGATATLDSLLNEDVNLHVEFFPFALFTTAGGFSFADVTSIRVILNPPDGSGKVDPNVDLLIDSFFTDRLQPDRYDFANTRVASAITLTKVVLEPECVADLDGSGSVPFFEPGDAISYRFTITNPGGTPLIVNLTDVNDNGTPLNLGDDITTQLIVNSVAQPGVVFSGDINVNGLLDTTETWLVTLNTTLTTLGYNSNVGTVTGTPTDGQGEPLPDVADVMAQANAKVFIAVAEINLEKRVNSKDANVEPPLFDHVLQGSAVNYTYLVTNTGNVILDITNFVDDNGTPGLGDDFTPSPVLMSGFNIGDADQDGRFDPGESWEFEQLSVVLNMLGLHTNIASVTGTPVDFNGDPLPPGCLEPQTDTDPANIVVVNPGIDLTKEVTSEPECRIDVDGTGIVPVHLPGELVTYRYSIANTGTTVLDVALFDDAGTPGVPGDDFDVLAFPGAVIVESGAQDGLLNVGETWTVTIQLDPNLLGFYENIATVTGTSLDGNGQPIANIAAVIDIDDAVVFIAVNDVSIQKLVNGQDANVEPPAFQHVLQGTAVNYTYLVTNHGNVIINLNNFRDDNGTPGNVGDDFQPTPVLLGGFNVGDADQDNRFDPGETWEFAHNGVVLNTLGLHTNIVGVTARAADFQGSNIDRECVDNDNAEDPANIIVDRPEIDLTKVVFNPQCVEDVDGQGAVPLFDPGDQVTYRYTIDNPGTTALIVDLVDVNDNGTPVNLGDDITTNLIVGGVAQPGVNIAGDTNTNNRLDTTETWIVTFMATVNTLGFNTNNAVVTGTPVDGQGQTFPGFADVTDTDDAVVYVATVGINIEKRVNGQDANVEPPPFQHVLPGDSVSYTYFVTNTGNVILNFVSLVDDGGPQPSFSPSGVLKPNTRNIGDADDDGRFDPGESWDFERINFVIDANTPPGPFTNIVTVVANPIDFSGEVIDPNCLPQVTDNDPATIIVDPNPSSIAGFVFEDCNNNGIYEPAIEFAIPGVTVRLFQNDVQVASDTTDASGKYLFENLAPGTYEIRETQPAGFLDGKEGLDLTPGSPTATIMVETLNQIFDKFTGLVLPVKTDAAFYNFGELKPSSLAGCVYIDVNNNGVKDGGEDAIAGVKIRLDGTDDRGNPVDMEINTDLNGLFKFNNLRPADANGYRLRETQPALFIDGKDIAGTVGGNVNSAQDRISSIALPACKDATDYCFGEFGLIVPSKRPFIFVNGDWQNHNNPLDVNVDGRINNQDALIVIDALHRLGIGKLPKGNGLNALVDIDGNDHLEPADLLKIINKLNVDALFAPGVVTGGIAGFQEFSDSESSTSASGARTTAQGSAVAYALAADQAFSSVGSDVGTTARDNKAAAASTSQKKNSNDDASKKQKPAVEASRYNTQTSTTKKAKAASGGNGKLHTVINRAMR